MDLLPIFARNVFCIHDKQSMYMEFRSVNNGDRDGSTVHVPHFIPAGSMDRISGLEDVVSRHRKAFKPYILKARGVFYSLQMPDSPSPFQTYLPPVPLQAEYEKSKSSPFKLLTNFSSVP